MNPHDNRIKNRLIAYKVVINNFKICIKKRLSFTSLLKVQYFYLHVYINKYIDCRTS